MEEIIALFQNNGNWSTTEEYEHQQKLINENNGIQVSSKTENSYIDIVYYNRVGQYKAQLLIQVFDRHKEFYQYFLKNYQKVVIQNNHPKDKNSEIVINNEPWPISTEELIYQMMSPYKRDYIGFVSSKIKKSNHLLTEEEALDLLKAKILDNDVKEKRIDFFKYLDLMNGKFINTKYYYRKALVDLCFQYHCYPILEQYMNDQNTESINVEIFKAIHCQYGLSLLNRA